MTTPASASPNTDRADALPASWNPGEVEGGLYQRWVEAGYFEADPSSDKPAYSVVLPPPNVTGSLHMGHALDHTLMDVLTRRKRMQGFEVLWLPGMDHAGIATQTLVDRKLRDEGIDRHEIGRPELRRHHEGCSQEADAGHHLPHVDLARRFRRWARPEPRESAR